MQSQGNVPMVAMCRGFPPQMPQNSGYAMYNANNYGVPCYPAASHYTNSTGVQQMPITAAGYMPVSPFPNYNQAFPVTQVGVFLSIWFGDRSVDIYELSENNQTIAL